jgi:hypothetical protein
MSRTALTVSADAALEARATAVADWLGNAWRDESIFAFDTLKPGLPYFVVSKTHERGCSMRQSKIVVKSQAGQSLGAWQRLNLKPETRAARSFTDP